MDRLDHMPPKMTPKKMNMTTAITPKAAAMNPSHVPMFALTRLNAVVIGCVMLNGASPDITGDVGGASPPGCPTPTPGSPTPCCPCCQ